MQISYAGNSPGPQPTLSPSQKKACDAAQWAGLISAGYVFAGFIAIGVGCTVGAAVGGCIVAFIGTGLAIANANNMNSQATITCTPH